MRNSMREETAYPFFPLLLPSRKADAKLRGCGPPLGEREEICYAGLSLIRAPLLFTFHGTT